MTGFPADSINKVAIERVGDKVIIEWRARSEYDAMMFYDELKTAMRAGHVNIDIATGSIQDE